MRPGLVRNVGLGLGALALVWLAACNDNPLDFDVKNSTGIVANPTEIFIPAGRTTKLQSRTVNQGGAPTYEQISASVDAACGSGAITVAEDPDDADIVADGTVPPGRFVITAGATLGQACVVLTSGSLTKQVPVTVVANGITIVSAPDSLRAGETGQVVAALVDLDGNPVLPFDPTNAGFSSENADVADFTDDMGNFSTSAAGSALFHVTWIGTEDNGTIVPGYVLEVNHVLTVYPNVPDTAFFTVGEDLGASPVGETLVFDITVNDAEGNRTAVPTEVTGVTVNSSNPAAVTAAAELIVDDPTVGEGAIPVVTLETVAAASVTISGVVQTTSGDLPYTGTLLVPNPIVNSVTPATGGYASFVTIAGTDFVPGLTKVYVDGFLLGNYTVDNDTQITAQMPTYDDPTAALDVVVSVAGVASPAGPTWTQTDSFDEAATEDNSFWNTSGQADISVPAFISGTQIGEPVDGLFGVQADWFYFTISGGTRTIDITATPLIASNDMVIDMVDGGFNFFWCNHDNTGAPSPDGGECELPGLGEELDPGVLSTGTWWVIPTEFFGADPVEYELEIVMVDD